MCPTTIGRIHTRVATIAFLPALLGVAISLITADADWIALIGLYLLMGVALDAIVYSWAVRYQPPPMTFVLAVIELGLLLALARRGVELTLPLGWSIAFYWGAWLLAVFTKIAILPNLSLTYLESAGEFRRTEWSIPPSRQSVPVYGSVAPGPGAVSSAAAASDAGGSPA